MVQLKRHLFSRHLLAFLALVSFFLTGMAKLSKNELDFAFWQSNFVLVSLLSIFVFACYWFNRKDWIRVLFDIHLNRLKTGKFDFNFIWIGCVYLLVIFFLLGPPSPPLLNLPFLREQLVLWISLPQSIRYIWGDGLIGLQRFLYFLFSAAVFLGLYVFTKNLWFKKEQKFFSTQPDSLQKILGLGSLLLVYLFTKIPLAITYLGDFYESFIWPQRAGLNFRISTQVLHRQLLNPYKFDPLFKLATLALFGLTTLSLLGVLLLMLKSVVVVLNRALYLDWGSGNICLFVLGRRLFVIDKSFLYSLLLLLAIFSPYYFLNAGLLKSLEFVKADNVALSHLGQKLAGDRVVIFPEERFTKKLKELNLEIGLFGNSYLKNSRLVLPDAELAQRLALLLTSRLRRSFLQEVFNEKIGYFLVFKGNQLGSSQVLAVLKTMPDALASEYEGPHLQIFRFIPAQQLQSCILNYQGLIDLIKRTVGEVSGKERGGVLIENRQSLLLAKIDTVSDGANLRFYDQSKKGAGQGKVLLEPVFALKDIQLGYFEFPAGADSFTAYGRNNKEIKVWAVNSGEAEKVLLKDCQN